MEVKLVDAWVGWSSYTKDGLLRSYNTVCGELEEHLTKKRLLSYTRDDRDILFPDTSDSMMHIRWLPLLEDLERCGRLSWGSAMLAWLYRQMCQVTNYRQQNLGGCSSLLLSCA
ncbi:hypothetical protein Ahy_A08g040351 [Arachis hypogaea]|uniref:Aminotransferase-like plant mobile domain-containing protein n=1 Tax=Arachis hypogaea TaxID=3818 RepID=A0A445BZL6_ARAHY|nr:hypothetical protein Ahy_A08g040351 [Arachis hypogaea]